MEGTVTISIKDFDELRRQKDIVDYIKRITNDTMKDGKFEVNGHEAIRLIDYITTKVFEV